MRYKSPVRIRYPFLLVALALGVLGTIAAAKLISDHRKDRLEEAFDLLAAGMERLNDSDNKEAQRQFRVSADRFQALGRDPLLALHHAFAARLRTHESESREVRQLSVPGSRDGEQLLAIALSEGSSLLAVATKYRLLCLPMGSSQWAEWALPQPIERVSALHVDTATGRAYVVAGDDGKLLMADCRASGSPLVTSPSSTENKAAVAWLDAKDGRMWAAPASPEGAEVRITATPLPGSDVEPSELKIAFPGEANSLFPKAAVIHSIAKIDDNVLLFYGDSSVLDDTDLRDESVLVISVAEPERQTNRLVFSAATHTEANGKTRWHTTHVRRLLPASAPGRIYALTENPEGVAILGSDAKPMARQADSLFSTEYHDGRETYDLTVKVAGDNAVMEIGRRGTEAPLIYVLPWQYKSRPVLATISGEGRHVVVANAAGEVLLIAL